VGTLAVVAGVVRIGFAPELRTVAWGRGVVHLVDLAEIRGADTYTGEVARPCARSDSPG